MSKYELNPFTNKEVMANVRVFRTLYLQGQGHTGVKVIYVYVSRKVLSQEVLYINMN